jgi:single-strand DNA-binding protein
MYINKALLYGNLTRDPEMKSLPSGIAVCSFSIATNRTWKDKNGAKQESVDYHNIVTFGRQAELVNQYLKKGSGIFVEGRIQTRSWDGKDGTKQYRTEVVAENFQFGPKGGGASGGSYGGGSTGGGNNPPSFSSQSSGGKSAPAKEPELDTIEYPEEDINPDDIPF